MKSKRSQVSLNIKDIRITQISVILVILVFLVQCFVLYRLYVSDSNLLQRELNLSIDEVYEADLNRRLGAEWGKPAKVAYIGDELPAELDSVNVTTFKKEEGTSSEEDAVSTISLAIEEYISDIIPINLNKMDSIATPILAKNNIKLEFYCEIVDLESNDVLSTSMPESKRSSSKMNSKNIPLNIKKTKALRLVLVDPMSKIYKEMAVMLVSTLVLAVILIYCFYHQRRALSKQKKLVEVKNDLFADISHEMKKPLSLISHAIDSFERDDIFFDTEKRTRNLKIVKNEVDWMSNHTNMVLSLAMEDEGVFELNCAEFDLGGLVSDLADKYTYTSNKHVNIEVLNELESPFVYADQNHMEHLMSNLITNSIKYSDEPVIIVIRLYNNKDGDVVLSIKDNGVGMSQEQQSHVFEKYYRVGTTSDVKGHGIGLNYVKRIVEKHKGEIVLVSELNKGSEFTIRLPQPFRKG